MEGLKAYRPWGVLPVLLAILFRCCTMQVDYANAKVIMVGGDAGWHYGFNYTDWISKTGKVYVNDTLVFKYPAPSPNSPPHSVVRLKHRATYQACLVNIGQRLAGPFKGIGKGFSYKLEKSQNYYFVCGVGNGTHCDSGLMKFFVRPVIQRA